MRRKKNTHCKREKETNSKWHTIELSTVLLPSENMEAVVLPYSGTGRLQQKERDFITLASEADVYLFNLKQTPRTGYIGQRIFTNEQRLSVSPRDTIIHLREIPGTHKICCIQFLGNAYNCHLKLSEYTETPRCCMGCIFRQQAA